MKDTRQNIVDAAHYLFFTIGSKNTTIRDISSKANVLNGSIYHYFKNKEAAFQAVITDVFSNFQEYVMQYYFGREISNAQMYCVITMCTLCAEEYDKRMEELVYEAFHSGDMIHKIAENAAYVNQRLFSQYNENFQYEDFYVRTLAMDGCVFACVSDHYLGYKIPFIKRISTFFNISLRTYNVPENIIHQTLSQENLEIMIEDTKQIMKKYPYRQNVDFFAGN